MYDTIAHYYDLIHSELTEDIKFLLRIAEPINGRLLELGSGTGRLVIPLARAGYKVTGIDLSDEMMAIGRRKTADLREAVQNRITFIEGNMISFELAQKFEMAIYGHNTFMHIGRFDIDGALKNIRSHLIGLGFLVIDVDNPIEVADSSLDHLLVLERTFKMPQSGDVVAQYASSWAESDEQVRHISWIFDRSPAAGGAVIRHIVETSFYYYYGHQIEIALDAAGFRIRKIFGDYDESPYFDNSPRMIVLAEIV
ncbi:MAG: class I SAM-dependent methyltransferase [Anaerolineae bacterium]|nr:MAG: class I SAM-dependent methyltransferase [Anaerolineae bacterium]